MNYTRVKVRWNNGKETLGYTKILRNKDYKMTTQYKSNIWMELSEETRVHSNSYSMPRIPHKDIDGG